MSPGLLTRDAFRERVFQRDRNTCVVPGCGKTAVDAHHVLERRLWIDDGYYVDNGVSVCAEHHLDAEATLISCEDLRRYAGIKRAVLPEHLCASGTYDKWGNEILPNGMRLRGELFQEDGTQKILSPVLHLFTTRVRYPRTFHLPWSPGRSDDDRVMVDPNTAFADVDVVVTEKLDGECTTMYRDYLHARSLDYAPHPSRDRIRALHASIAHDIPEGWRLCGENVYAMHSIAYDALPSHFLVFSVWNDKNECLSWDETVYWAHLLGLSTVPTLARGQWEEDRVRAFDDVPDSRYGREREGYVVRRADSFHYRAFRRSVAKYVRKDHVHTDDHWKSRPVLPNQLASDAR